MLALQKFNSSIKYLLTDIDDTMTDEGLLGAEAYQALWRLHESGIKVIHITGRPAGWCEMIARFWPVAGVVGENGGFYFRYANKKMNRFFVLPSELQEQNRKKLELIRKEVLEKVPGCDIASDQFCRLMDLAVDFCEDVPALPKEKVQQIVSIFQKHGAQAKVSSIHVNGWFGQYDKLSTALLLLEKEFGVSQQEALQLVAYSGDSPNDEPMFSFFPNSFGVANVKNFQDQMKHLPKYCAEGTGGHGFAQIAETLLENL